ncbi:unnamed protein product [Clonostachys chloroleuca]|uniref:F-box domain-containing protein n=1 Tax=Clonostachys chloroleuca TaxID=1926264 RepID=A0AA35M1A2_9HYPO|nr:unnamed protein product [Clonostachys chloroleuca]
MTAQHFGHRGIEHRFGTHLTEECEYMGPQPEHFYHIHPVSNVESMPDESTDALGVGDQPAYNNRRGFVFHAHCWCVLNMANGPSPINPRRLFDVCSSLPMIGNTLFWGHDYLGLPGLYNDSGNASCTRFPGLSRDQGGYIVQLDPIHDHPDLLFNSNRDVPPALPVPLMYRRPRRRRRREKSEKSEAQDPFSRLPTELILMIAARIETTDALKMRQATRAFWPLLHDQAFWKSKFGPGSERAWVFTVYHASEHSWLFNSFNEPERRRWLEYGSWQPEDWRSLWRQTRPRRINPELRNLKRVWELAEAILSILRMKRGPTWNDDPLPQEAGVGYWLKHGGHIEEYIERAMRTGDAYTFDYGCRQLYKLHTVVRKSLRQLTFYFMDLAGSRYLAGLKMTDSSGDERLMGYESPIAVEFCPYNLGRTFRGFTTAANTRGIVALRVHWSTHVSEWIGEAKGAQTWKIWVSRRVRFMEVGFDGFKIVNMRVHYPGTTLIDEEKEIEKLSRWEARFLH